MTRFISSVVVVLALTVTPAAQANYLSASRAQEAVERFAPSDFDHARTYVTRCPRISYTRRKCFVGAFYSSGSRCLAVYFVKRPYRRVYVRGPLLTRCS